jgi:hypothetical protein
MPGMAFKNDGPEFDFKRSLKTSPPVRIPKFAQVDRLVNRPIAALIVRAVLRTNLRPNHLTVAAFVLGLAGAFFFLGGDHRSFIIAGILIYAGTILDGADGMLARSKQLCTRRGAYLDLYLDRVTDFAVLGAMVTGYYLQSGRLGFYILSLLGLAAYMLQILLYYLEREYWSQRRPPGPHLPGPPGLLAGQPAGLADPHPALHPRPQHPLPLHPVLGHSKAGGAARKGRLRTHKETTP